MRRKGPQPPDVARFLNHDTRARRPHDGPGSAPPRGVRPCPHTFALQPTSPLAEAVERREVSRSCAVPMELSPRRNACLPLGEARLRRRVVVTRHGSWWIWRLPGGLGLDAEETVPGPAGADPGPAGQMRNGCSHPTRGPQSEAKPLRVPRRSSDDDPEGSGGRHSEARLPARGPWLCVPDSRPVCLCRVAFGAPQDIQEVAKGKLRRGIGPGNVFQPLTCA